MNSTYRELLRTMEHRYLLWIVSLISISGYFVLSTEVEITIHPLTEIVADILANGGIYKAISEDMIVASHGEVLSVQNLNGTSSEATLNFRPDDIHPYKLPSEVHVIATAHAERSSENQIACCVYYATEQLSCNIYHRHTPPTTFVHSVHIDEHDRVNVYAVYYEFGYLVYHNVKGGYEEYSLQLPENCTCSSNCLEPVEEPSGSVKVGCDDGPTYLYNFVTDQFFFVSPSKVKQLAISSNNGAVFEAIPAEEMYRDILVQRNMASTRENASAQYFPDTHPAIQSSPRIILDVTIVALNKTELVVLIWNTTISTEISYLDLGASPNMEYLPQHSNVTWGAKKGVCESNIFVESTDNNGSTVLITIEFLPEGSTTIPNITTDPLDNDTQLNTSSMPQHNSSTDEKPQNPPRPVDDDSQPANQTNNLENSPSTTDGSINEMVPGLIGFAIGVGVTLAIFVSIAALLMICYRMRNSKGYNIEQYSKQYNNNEKV